MIIEVPLKRNNRLLRIAWMSSLLVALFLISGCNSASQSSMQGTATPSIQTTHNFVTRSGSQLLLNGQPFRFAGPNIYWLGLAEGTGSGTCLGGACGYPSQFQVDDAL